MDSSGAELRHGFFISFAWEALERALKLYDELGAKPEHVFLAEKSLPQDVDLTELYLEEELGSALRQSGALVVLWGRAYSGSRWCRWEIDYFRAHCPGRPIFVLAVDGAEFPADPKLREDICFIEGFQDLREARARPSSIAAAPEPSSKPPLWLAPLLLLGAPNRWSAMLGPVSPNASAFDFVAPQLFGPPEQGRRWAVSTFTGCILINAVSAAIAFILGWAVLGADPEKLGRELLFSGMISLVAGSVLALGHGLGAGAATLVVSGAVGFGTTLLYRLLDGTGGAPSAAAAGAVIAAAAAYRIHLSPVVGLETPRPPRLGLTAISIFAAGLGVGTALIEAGFSFHLTLVSLVLQLPVNGQGMPEWSELPLPGRVFFGVGVGALAGITSAWSFRQRLAFQVRPRDQRMRGWQLSVASALVWMLVGGLAAGLGAPAGTDAEALIIGTLVGLIATSLYLLPLVPFGLRMTEGRKAAFGFLGAVFLVGVGHPYLRAFTGIVRKLEVLDVFLAAGLAGTFGVLLVALHRVAAVRQVGGWVLGSLVIHGLLLFVLSRPSQESKVTVPPPTPLPLVTAPPVEIEVNTVPAPQSGAAPSEVLGDFFAQGIDEKLPPDESGMDTGAEETERSRAADDELLGGKQDEPAEDPAGDDKTVQVKEALAALINVGGDDPTPGTGSAEGDGDGSDETAGGESAGAEAAERHRLERYFLRKEAGLPSVSRDGKWFRIYLPPGYQMHLKTGINARKHVGVELADAGSRMTPLGNGRHAEPEQRRARTFTIHVPTARDCRQEGSGRQYVLSCEDESDWDWDEPRIELTFVDAWPDVSVN
jgi:hypothetical protein